jgi:hypothetical protein
MTSFQGTRTSRSSATRASRRPSVPLLALAGLISTVLTIGGSGVAQADTRQPDGPPDGGDHSWCYLADFNQKTAADAAMTRLRNQTDVTTNYPGACGGHTDVRWRQGGLVDAYGEAVCVLTRADGDCDVYRITLDMAEINNAPRPVDQRTKTSCHELGHTAGVRHYTAPNRPGNDTADSCLRSGPVTAGWASRVGIYGNHHRTAHINVTF